MAGITTDVILIGDRSVGPFAVREWRVRNAIALIAKQHRVWMPTGMAHGIPDSEPLGPLIVPGGLTAAQELVLLIAATAVKSRRLLDELALEGFTRTSADRTDELLIHFDERSAERVSIDPALVELAVQEVVDVVRIGRVQLSPDSDLDANSVTWLRSKGFDIEEYHAITNKEG